MSKILFWAGFGVAVRLWTLGIQRRPYFQRSMKTIGAYSSYATVGGTFGYWLTGVEERQRLALEKSKQTLLEKRQRVAEREAIEASA